MIVIDTITIGLLTIFIGIISTPIAFIVNYFIKRYEERKELSKEIAINRLNPLLIELTKIQNKIKLLSYYPEYFEKESISKNKLSGPLFNKLGDAFIYLQNNHLRKSLLELTLVLEQLELLTSSHFNELDKTEFSETLIHVGNSISKIFEGLLNILFTNTKVMKIPNFKSDSEEDFIYSRLEEAMELIERSFHIETKIPDEIGDDLTKKLDKIKFQIKKG